MSRESKRWTFDSITADPDGLNTPAEEKGNFAWRQQLCCCFQKVGCCLPCWVLWCQPCTLAQVVRISGAFDNCFAKGSKKWAFNLVLLTLLSLGVASSVFELSNSETLQDLSTVVIFVAFIFATVCLFIAKSKIRTDSKVAGGDFTDLLTSMCCMPCVICQLFAQKRYRASCEPEIDAAGRKSIDYHTPCDSELGIQDK